MATTDRPDELGTTQHNGSTAPQLATEAEEALQGIVHLTESDSSRLTPEDLYRTLSALTRLVEQLPEVVSRVAARVSAWSGTDGLVVTSGPFHGDPEGAIEALSAAVRDEVLPAAGRLRTGLTHAQAAINELVAPAA